MTFISDNIQGLFTCVRSEVGFRKVSNKEMAKVIFFVNFIYWLI